KQNTLTRPTFRYRGHNQIEITWSSGSRCERRFCSARELLAFAETIEPDRYAEAPDRAVWLRHTAAQEDVHVTRTGRITARKLLHFEERAVADAPDLIPTAEDNGESFQDGVIRLSIENQALHDHLTIAKAELATFLRKLGNYCAEAAGL